MHPSLTVLNSKALDFINPDFRMMTLAGDCAFTEGPIWNNEGYYLFSDTTANCIYRIGEQESKTLFLNNSGTDLPGDPDLKPDQVGSNGLAYDADGNLLICRHGAHAIGSFSGTAINTLVDSYKGKPLNSPNDLIVHSNGAVYFSDPPYGLKDSKLHPSKFQQKAGVYCYRDGELVLICDDYEYPNGVCLSPDETKLYICSHKPFEKRISVYNTKDHSYAGIVAEENSDGIETDPSGNLYLFNAEGLILLDQDGMRMATISLPAVPANGCWGGRQRSDLLITARQYVILLKDFLRPI